MNTKFKANRAESEYWWQIHLDPNNENNRVPYLTGYSEGKGKEDEQKDRLLMNKVKNPLSRYFERMTSIVVYRNSALAPKAEHLPILTLTRYGWTSNDNWLLQRPFLVNYFNSLYKNGKISLYAAHDKEVMQKRIPMEVFREHLHHKMRFRNHDEILAFCDSKISICGKPAVEGWYQIHIHDFQPELLVNAKPIQPISSAFLPLETKEPFDPQQFQAYQNGLNELVNKFNARK